MNRDGLRSAWCHEPRVGAGAGVNHGSATTVSMSIEAEKPSATSRSEAEGEVWHGPDRCQAGQAASRGGRRGPDTHERTSRVRSSSSQAARSGEGVSAAGLAATLHEETNDPGWMKETTQEADMSRAADEDRDTSQHDLVHRSTTTQFPTPDSAVSPAYLHTRCPFDPDESITTTTTTTIAAAAAAHANVHASADDDDADDDELSHTHPALRHPAVSSYPRHSTRHGPPPHEVDEAENDSDGGNAPTRRQSVDDARHHHRRHGCACAHRHTQQSHTAHTTSAPRVSGAGGRNDASLTEPPANTPTLSPRARCTHRHSRRFVRVCIRHTQPTWTARTAPRARVQVGAKVAARVATMG